MIETWGRRLTWLALIQAAIAVLIDALMWVDGVPPVIVPQWRRMLDSVWEVWVWSLLLHFSWWRVLAPSRDQEPR